MPRLLRSAAADGHTALSLAAALAATGDAQVQASLRSGTVVGDGSWVSLDELATAEAAVADEVIGLAADHRLALVLGTVPEDADVVVVEDVHRRALQDVAAQLQSIPEEARVVISGDPDALTGAPPGAVLADLLAWGQLPVRDLRAAHPFHPDAGSLTALVAALRLGELPEPTDTSVAVVPCAADADVVRRAVQIVTDSVPRVFGIPPAEVAVLCALNRGTAGVAALAAALPAGTQVSTVHDAAGGPRHEAVVLCLPGQAAGVLSRALVYSAAVLARRHMSVVTAAGAALPDAVAIGDPRPRRTRLLRLLREAAS